eukprot:5155313-Pleurochrysis_carterae.AAC.1
MGLASHAYSRTARAPLPKLLITARAWPTSLRDCAPDRCHRAGAPQPPRPRSLPSRDYLYFV